MTQTDIDNALEQVGDLAHRLTLLENDIHGAGHIFVENVTVQDRGKTFKIYPREDNEGFYCHWWQALPETEGVEGTTAHRHERAEAVCEAVDIVLRLV